MYSIGQLSEMTKVKASTIRFYEEKNLIKPTNRSEGNQRRYSQAEAEKLSKELLSDLSNYCIQLGTPKPKIYLKKGNTSNELIKLINNESLITVLVLGASTETGNPGPLINFVTNASNECRIPITIVPGNLTDQQIDNLI